MADRVQWRLGGLVPWQGTPQDNPQVPRSGAGPNGRLLVPGGVEPYRPEGPRVVTFDPWRFVQLRGSQVLTLANSVSTQILQSSDIPRNYLSIRNSSATSTPNIYVDFGNNASAASVFKLVQDTIIAWDTGVPQDDIYVFADAAGAQVSFTFSTLPF